MWQFQKTSSPCSPACPRTWTAPTSSLTQPPHPPAQPWSLQFVSAAAPASMRGAGCLVTWITSTYLEGGWQLKYVHTPTDCHAVKLLSMKLALPHIFPHTHTHTHTHNTALMETPCGGFGNPSTDPNVFSQSRTKAHHHLLLLNPRGRVPFLPVCSSWN